MDVRHESTFAAIAALQHQIASTPSTSHSKPTSPLPTFRPSDTPPNTESLLSPHKLQLPIFDSSDPLDWIFQAAQFFDYYSVLDDQRLHRISCYPTGDALGWFKWMHNNHLLSTWDAFIRTLELRFGPSSFENHRQALFKVRESGSVVDYQLEFECLCNRVVGLSPDSILDCFLSGHRADIQKEMAILHSTTISQVVGLAKLIESKLQDQPYLSRGQPLAASPVRRVSPQ